MVSVVGMPLPELFPATKPAQPAKPMPEMPSNSSAIVLKLFLLMPFAEGLVVTICFRPPMSTACSQAAAARVPHAHSGYAGHSGGRNWTSDEKEDKCAYTTLHCPLGQASRTARS